MSKFSKKYPKLSTVFREVAAAGCMTVVGSTIVTVGAVATIAVAPVAMVAAMGVAMVTVGAGLYGTLKTAELCLGKQL